MTTEKKIVKVKGGKALKNATVSFDRFGDLEGINVVQGKTHISINLHKTGVTVDAHISNFLDNVNVYDSFAEEGIHFERKELEGSLGWFQVVRVTTN